MTALSSCPITSFSVTHGDDDLCIVGSFGKQPQLEYVSLEGCDIARTLFNQILDSPLRALNLVQLSVRGVLWGEDTSCWLPLQSMTTLQECYLSTIDVYAIVSNLPPSVHTLHMDWHLPYGQQQSRTNTDIVVCLAKLPRLTDLDLGTVPDLHGTELRALKTLVKLRLHATCPCDLSQCSKLTDLEIRLQADNTLLSDLSDLTRLTVHSNLKDDDHELNWQLSACKGKLTHLTLRLMNQ
jgi:hypothetical protein